ncbi:MAG: ABC transporter permease [Actinomycetia bacterium]|nr:ABC transporter permease [Actinomycetes bacterium]
MGAQAGIELRLMMGNGEQILLTLIIPVILLVGFSLTNFVNLGGETRSERVDLLVPAILALAIMSSAFTAQAIATGFDRRSEAIKFLGTTPLSRTGLLSAKVMAVFAIQVGQVGVILLIGLLLGWRASGPWPLAVVFIALGTAAFTSLGLALAGVLRAEITLAAANAIYLLLLLGGGILIPPDDLPGPLGLIARLLPSGALADGLRGTLGNYDVSLIGPTLVLLAWTAAGSIAVRRTFKWTS